METPAKMLAKTLDHLRYAIVAISVAGSIYGISKGIISFFSQFALPWWIHAILIILSIAAGAFVAYKIDSGIFHATKALADAKGKDKTLVIIVFAFLAFANYVTLQIGAATSINELYSTKIKEVSKTKKVKSILFAKETVKKNIEILKKLAEEIKEEIKAKDNLIEIYKEEFEKSKNIPDRFRSKRERRQKTLLESIKKLEDEKKSLLDKKIVVEAKITKFFEKLSKLEDKKVNVEEEQIKSYESEKDYAQSLAFLIFLIFIVLHLLIGFLTRKLELIDNGSSSVAVASSKKEQKAAPEPKIENYYDLIYDLCIEASQEASGNNFVLVEDKYYLKQLGRDALIPALNNKLYKLYKEGKIDVQIKMDSKKLSAYQQAYEHMYIVGPKNVKLFKFVSFDQADMAINQ